MGVKVGLFGKFNKRSLYYKGVEFKEQGKLDKALECFNEVLEMDNEYVNAWYRKGQIFAELE